MAEKKQNLVSVEKDYLDELKSDLGIAKYESGYYRGRVNGMEYVIDALQEILKREETRQ